VIKFESAHSCVCLVWTVEELVSSILEPDPKKHSAYKNGLKHDDGGYNSPHISPSGEFEMNDSYASNIVNVLQSILTELRNLTIAVRQLSATVAQKK
jgi:hypothetical protein